MALDAYKLSIFNDDRLYNELKQKRLLIANLAGYPTITKEVMTIINTKYSQILEIAKKNIEEAFQNGINEAEEKESSDTERDFIDPITGKKETRIGKLAHHGPNTYIKQHPMIQKAVDGIKNQKADIFTLGPKMILKLFDVMENGSNILKGIHKDINEIKKAFKPTIKPEIEKEKIKEDVETIKAKDNDKIEPDELLAMKLQLISDDYSTLISSLITINSANNPINNQFIAIIEKNKMLINQKLINAFNSIVVIRNSLIGIKSDFNEISKKYSNELNSLSLIYQPYDKNNIKDSFNALNEIKNIGIDNTNLIVLTNLLEKLSKINITKDVIQSLNAIFDLAEFNTEINGIIINYNFTVKQLESLSKYKCIKKGINNEESNLQNIYLEWESKDGVIKSCNLIISNSSYVLKDIKNTDKLKEGTRVIILDPKIPKENSKLIMVFDNREQYIIDKLIKVSFFKENKEEKETSNSSSGNTEELQKSQEKYNAAMLRLTDKDNNFKNWQEVHDNLKKSYENRKIKVYDIISKLSNKGELAKKDMLAYKVATGQLSDISWIQNFYSINRILYLLNIKEEGYTIIANILKEKMKFSFKNEDLIDFNNGKEKIDKLTSLINKLLPEDISEYNIPYDKWNQNYENYISELKKVLRFIKEKLKPIPYENIKKDVDYNEYFYKIILEENGDLFEDLAAGQWFYNDFVDVIKPKTETVKIIIKNKKFMPWILEKKEK